MMLLRLLQYFGKGQTGYRSTAKYENPSGRLYHHCTNIEILNVKGSNNVYGLVKNKLIR